MVVNDNTFYRFLSTKTNQTWYCSQRKSKKCRASFRFFPTGHILPVIVDHTHEKLPINARIFSTVDPLELYNDTDNSLHIDMNMIEVLKSESI